MSRKKKEGKIRHLGFSFHDRPELLTRIVEEHEWDFAQIQLNYLDWELQNAARQYEILTDHGLPVVVMEPVRGGTLATLSESACQILRAADPSASPASWAIRFAASLPNVMTVLSGMSNMEQVQDNVATMNAFFPLTEREREVLAEALHAFKLASTIPCTGCRYCMDCPAGVDIPGVFATYNQYCITKNAIAFETGYDVLGAEHQASHCVNCKACLPKCPQHIAIPDRLREIDQTAKKLFSQT